MKIPVCPKCDTMVAPVYFPVAWACLNPQCGNFSVKIEPEWASVVEEGRYFGSKAPSPERAKAVEGASREEEIALLKLLQAKYPEVKP